MWKKFLNKWEYQTTLPVSWETCMQVKKQQLVQNMEQLSSSKLIQITKVFCQGYILSPWVFNLYAEYIVRNVGLDEAQTWIKIARRNISNLRYATLKAEKEDDLKSLLMRVQEGSEKAGLKFSIQKLRSWQLVPSLHGKYKVKSGNCDRFYFLGLQNHCRWWLQHEIKRCFLLGRKAATNLDGILKRRNITVPTKVRRVKGLVFPVVMYRCESWSIEKAGALRNWYFKLWCYWEDTQ